MKCTVNAEREGDYTVTIRYANRSLRTDRIKLRINGAGARAMRFPPAEGVDAFLETAAPIHLKGGENTLSFESVQEACMSMLDCLALTQASR